MSSLYQQCYNAYCAVFAPSFSFKIGYFLGKVTNHLVAAFVPCLWPRALGHSDLVSTCKCAALAMVNSCSFFQPYRIEDGSVSGKWLQRWIKYLGTRVICVPNGKRVLVSELCLIMCDYGTWKQKLLAWYAETEEEFSYDSQEVLWHA